MTNIQTCCRKNLWHFLRDLFSIHKQNVFWGTAINSIDQIRDRKYNRCFLALQVTSPTTLLLKDLVGMWGWKYHSYQHQNQNESQDIVLFSTGSILYICAINGSDKFASFRPIQSTWSNFGIWNRVKSKGNSRFKVIY